MRDAYRIVDYASDMEEFLGTVVEEPPILVGCSLGDHIACCVAARSEVNVLGILMEDPPLYVGQMPDLGETLFYPFFELLTTVLPEHHQANGTIDDLLPKVRNPLVSEDLRARDRPERRPLDADCRDLAGTLFDGFDPDEELPRITCPVRAIIARGEPGGDAVRDRDIARMAEKISDFTQTLWKDTIHAIHYQRPMETVSEIRAFAEQIGRETPA